MRVKSPMIRGRLRRPTRLRRGTSEMPDTIRATARRHSAHPRRRGFVAGRRDRRRSPLGAAPRAPTRAATLGLRHSTTISTPSRRSTAHEHRRAGADARRHPVRAWSPRSRWCARARAPRADARRAADRDQRRCARSATAPTRCCSPSRRSSWSWPAGRDEPDILGDTDARHAARRCRTACSPSAPGSSRTRRRRMEDAVEALRADGEGFSHAR